MTFLYKVRGVDVYATGVSEQAARDSIQHVHHFSEPFGLDLLGVATSTDDVFCCPMQAQMMQEGRLSV